MSPLSPLSSDLNNTEHQIANGERPNQLNLRQFVEFRQRQLQLDPMSAYGAELVASVVGNYTCTVSSTHGSSSSSIHLKVQGECHYLTNLPYLRCKLTSNDLPSITTGRPLCKLKLTNEHLGPDNELIANLRCYIYSVPPLLETSWFKQNQQLAINKSDEANWMPFSTINLPLMVLNRQQDFMLADLLSTNTNQAGNIKCLARNSIGFSEACELSPSDRQALLSKCSYPTYLLVSPYLND